MIPWISGDGRNVWLRFVVSILLFGWMVYIAWSAHRDYRNMADSISKNVILLREDHARAEIAIKTLAAQVLHNTQETRKSTEVIKQLPEEIK
jgi:hypothetical protein